MPILHWDKPQHPEDWERWNARLVNKTTDHPHIEIRTTRSGQDILIAVSEKGAMRFQFGNKPTEYCNIRLSSSLPIKFSFEDWASLNRVIKAARRKLKRLQNG
jgi:hypothetical protein